MINYYLIIFLMTVIASFASFYLKKSTTNVNIRSIILSGYLYLGSSLYLIAAILNIWILQKLPYSVVVPLGSFTYIWTLIIAKCLLNERISIGKITGVGLIISGVICIAI